MEGQGGDARGKPFVAHKKAERRPRRPPARALSEQERGQVLELLHSERFVDCSPAQVYATLLDEGRYLASVVGWPSPRVGVHGGQVIAATKRWWRSWSGGEP